MAMRKKDPPKAMTAVRADFVASLDNVTQQGIMLLTCIETFLNHSKENSAINKGTRELLEERTAAFRAALIEPIVLHDD